MPYRKKLIEVALPLEAINVASAREKSIRHGHPSTLHLWWARRPLAACRAVIFTSLVDDPDDPTAPAEFIAACRALPKGKNASGVDTEGNSADTPRQRLFDFIERLVTWEATTDEVILEKARELIRLCTNGNPPPLLDPFAGGGSIPLEAQRLGLEAHASDLNPVAVMINKALIEIPPKFANHQPVNPRDRAGTASGGSWKGAAGLAADVRYYGEWMRDRAWERIGHLYPKLNGETVIAWLWARTVKCPNPACGARMPLVRSFNLSTKTGKAAWVEPQVDLKTRSISFEVKQASKGNGPNGTMSGQGGTCLVCDTPAPFSYIRAEGQAGKMGAQLMAIVTDGKNERNYYAPVEEHASMAKQAQPTWKPDQKIPTPNHNVDRLPMYGMFTWGDAFTPRQLVTLTTYSGLIAEVRQKIQADALLAGLPNDDVPLWAGHSGARAYAEAVSVYLAFCIDKMTTTNSSICTWQTKPTRLVAAFGRHTISMVWDYAEANPFSGAAGDYSLAIDSLTKVVDNLIPLSIGRVYQEDATKITKNNSYLISTDPPYYDNIGYADLSDYFYVWQRPSLSSVYPEIFSTLLVPKEAELVATPYRFQGSKDLANEHFERGLQHAFEKFREISIPAYPISIFYAFKQSEMVLAEEIALSSTGWETMLEALISAGFTIDGTWPIRTELTVALKATVNALASSIVLVCRPRPEEAPTTSRSDFVNALRRELPLALHEMQSGSIAPVDLAQATIGPGMAVYSRYARVLEPDGNRLTVRTALQLINHELDAYLTEQEGAMDTDSRFAVAWFEQFGFNEGGFGQADVLARAKNTSVDSLGSAGILSAEAGKVRLLTWQELDPGWDPTTDTRPTVWEATHHLIERLNTHGEEGAARLLARLPPDLAADARQLAYRLYSLCERKSWADLARDYNALVISWNASQEQARTFKDQLQQGKLL